MRSQNTQRSVAFAFVVIVLAGIFATGLASADHLSDQSNQSNQSGQQSENNQTNNTMMNQNESNQSAQQNQQSNESNESEQQAARQAQQDRQNNQTTQQQMDMSQYGYFGAYNSPSFGGYGNSAFQYGFAGNYNQMYPGQMHPNQMYPGIGNYGYSNFAGGFGGYGYGFQSRMSSLAHGWAIGVGENDRAHVAHALWSGSSIGTGAVQGSGNVDNMNITNVVNTMSNGVLVLGTGQMMQQGNQSGQQNQGTYGLVLINAFGNSATYLVYSLDGQGQQANQTSQQNQPVGVLSIVPLSYPDLTVWEGLLTLNSGQQAGQYDISLASWPAMQQAAQQNQTA